MAGPWEKYAQDTAASATGPWDKYGGTPVAAPRGPVAPLERLPPDSPAASTALQHADTIAERLLGLGKSAVGLGEAGLSAVTGALAAPVGAAYGVGKTLSSGKYGTQHGIEEGEKAGAALANGLTYQPRTEAGRSDVEALGNMMDASKLAGLPVEGTMIARIPEVPRGVLATEEGVAGAARAGANAVGRGAVRAAARALPEVDPETLRLAREAHQMGFRFRPDQMYENKFGRIAGQLTSDVPFSGETSSANQRVFNQRLISAIGGEGDKLTRQVYANAMKKSGTEIDTITAAHSIPVDNAFLNRLQRAKGNQLPEVQGVVQGYIDDLEALAGPRQKLAGGGATSAARQLDGAKLRPYLTKLKSTIRSTSNGDLRHALSDLQGEIEDAFLPQLSADEAARYAAARRQYAMGKTIEPLVAKSPGGNISPKALMGAVTSNAYGKRAMAMGQGGELGKLADIGSLFLREPGTSNTAERGIVAGLMAGGAGLAPFAAVPPWLAANAYNRFGPAVTEQLLQRPPAP
ncbi:hypothetical protein [Burkholderia sp. RF4-BP95]|uniref:hypothetical protein n=1 Tax=Burkholderia sp. RF4-BP95 TaxID=1637845 RepID=UPI0007548254|nr:hypothetical protein [Burkholderia sp. RF4-BP95]KUY70796.1 hypothetical protein WS46_31980 [Burkholderia sp. RF4-BP95]